MELDWYHILILICIGAFGLWISIPYGLAFGFDPWIICATNIIGSSFGVIAVYYLGKYIVRILNRKGSKKLISRSRVKMLRIMDKRGLIGLGLLMPGLFGPSLGMAISITMVINLKKLLFWTIIGNILWSVLLITLVELGISIF